MEFLKTTGKGFVCFIFMILAFGLLFGSCGLMFSSCMGELGGAAAIISWSVWFIFYWWWIGTEFK